MKVPEVKTCCFCFPLRHGIIVFGYINILLALIALGSLIITTEYQRLVLMNDTSLEVITETVLFSVFAMSVILNILLLVAGYQKDIPMLRLYNYYGVGTTLAALVPTVILISRMMIMDALAAIFAIVMQCYVIIMVRSEVVKLEMTQNRVLGENPMSAEEIIDIPDRSTLL